MIEEIIKSAVLGVLTALGGYLLGYWRNIGKSMKAMRKGMQSLLRDRLLQAYRYFSARGYAEVDDRENFRNMYEQYHALGKNGVMDDIYRRFMELPLEKKEEKSDED